LRDSDVGVGLAAVALALDHDGLNEVGYGVSPASRGQGAATAALNMLSVLAFEAGYKDSPSSQGV